MQFKIVLAVTLLLGFLVLENRGMAANLPASTILVSNGNDDGPGSLRAAIRDATPGSTISLSFVGVISLTSKLLIDKNLTLTGPGSTVVTVARNENFGLRLLEVSAGVNVTISGLAFSGGYVQDVGGGILNHGVLVLNDVRVVGNKAIGGGFPIQDIANGAGCVNTAGAEMSLTNCTVTGNECNGSGGGILNDGTLTVKNSLISNNIGSFGGGVVSNGPATITNSTISGNKSVPTGPHGFQGGYTGGMALGDSSTLSSDTITNNQCVWQGGGISASNAAITNCILAGNTATAHPETADLAGSVQSGGHNLVGVSMAGDGFGGSDLTGTLDAPLDPRLGSLRNNGGPTFTNALLPGSPAIDHGVSDGLVTDQRGFPRVFDRPEVPNGPGSDGADIGAFELGPSVPVFGNISTRMRVETADNVLIGGFIILGSEAKKVIVRAIGPTLSVPDPLVDPILELHDSTRRILAMNDNWQESPDEEEIINSGIPPTNSMESAIIATLAPGQYTAIVRGANGGTGVALVEVYDLDQPVTSKLENISTRGFVQTGDDVMIAGLCVLGGMPTQTLIRALGPSLPVTGALADPTVELHNADGTLMVSNDDWRSDQEADIVATTIPPPNDKESAILATLTPGLYTAIVRGKDNATGIALVEAYQLGN